MDVNRWAASPKGRQQFLGRPPLNRGTHLGQGLGGQAAHGGVLVLKGFEQGGKGRFPHFPQGLGGLSRNAIVVVRQSPGQGRHGRRRGGARQPQSFGGAATHPAVPVREGDGQHVDALGTRARDGFGRGVVQGFAGVPEHREKTGQRRFRLGTQAGQNVRGLDLDGGIGAPQLLDQGRYFGLPAGAGEKNKSQEDEGGRALHGVILTF